MPFFAIKATRKNLLIEFFVLFLLIPLILFIWTPTPILPFLWLIAGYCFYILVIDKNFKRKRLTKVKAVRKKNIKPLLIQFFSISIIFTLILYMMMPAKLFSLIENHPIMWILVILIYPIFSVYPQEIVYRAFFFHRYKKIFRNKELMIIINSFLFGYLHIIFHNWIAVILTIGGGYLFATLYKKTHSLALLFVSHSLYGCMLFTIGLGEFFYTGTISIMDKSVKF